jgi:transposase
MLIGYARVSTDDQNLNLQRDALTRAGCGRIFEEKESGRAGTKRPALEAALAFLRPEDQLVVWKVDRLGRSLRQMLETAHRLQGQGVKLRSLTEAVDTETPTGRLMFNFLEPVWRRVSEQLALRRDGVSSCVPASMKARYPSSLTDAQWALVRQHLPELVGGRRRHWPTRLVIAAVFYVVRTGCQWRQLPRDFPPWQTVYYHHRRWDGRGLLHRLHEALRRAVRAQCGRAPNASAGVMDSQSVRTTQAGGVRGYNGGKGVQGRKRQLLVDTEGLVLAHEVTGAHVSDQAGARRLL